MESLCIDFLKVDPSWDGKKNVLVLTDAFSKSSQAFVTPNQKAHTITKALVDKWLYVYSIPTWIHSNKGHSFENGILTQLYSMNGIKQSTTMPYNPCSNSICEQFNHTLLNLLKLLPKEWKSDWLSYVPSLVAAYNATPHSITGYQPYELTFGHKAPTICDAWLGLANYDDVHLRSKCSYIHEQYELITSANQCALKHIKVMAKQSVARAGGKPLQMPVGNLVVLRDHPKGWNNIQDSDRSELFVMESQHQNPNVYSIKPVSGKGVVWCERSTDINCLTWKDS